MRAMNNPGHSAVEYPNAAGLPMYWPTDAPPWRARIAESRAAMSSRASSQVTSSNSPSGRRRNGVSTRSGSFWMSVNAMPFGHARPWDSGWSGSGRSDTSRSFSTAAISPHIGSQIRQ